MQSRKSDEKPVELGEAELDFLSKHNIGRVATVSPTKKRPHVVPVLYFLHNGHVVFGGAGLEHSLKFKHIVRNPHIAFVVDSVVSLPSWTPVGIELRGDARIITLGDGRRGIELVPSKKATWGLDIISQTGRGSES